VARAPGQDPGGLRARLQPSRRRLAIGHGDPVRALAVIRRQHAARTLVGMASVVRMRVEVPDRAGALAGVTAVLAELGVDVASVDVLEVDGSTVVDELLLRLPDGVRGRDVQLALRSAGAVEAVPADVAGPTGDATVRALGLLTSVLAAPEDADAPGRGLARVAYADVGMFLDRGEALRFPLGRRALETAVPVSGRAGPDASPLASPGGWVLWTTPSVEDPLHIAVVARSLDVRFSATEAARLRAFATGLEQVSRVGL
jgi:hypothetical protein